MKNYVQEGDVLDVVLTADITSGDVVVAGKLKGIATTDGKNGETIAVRVEGVISLPKAQAVTFAAGAAVSWDDAANTAVATGGVLIGYAVSSPSPTEVWVKLTPSAA